MHDHGEDPARNFFASDRPAAPLDGNPLDDASSSPEYAMDEVAISRYGRALPPQLAAPARHGPRAGLCGPGLDVTPEHIMAGHAIGLAMMSAERAVAAEEGPRVEQDMPGPRATS